MVEMTIIRLSLIALLSVLCNAQDCNNQLMCQKARQFAQDVCATRHIMQDDVSMVRRGKTGPRGFKGEAAVVDYDRIIRKVEEIYSPVVTDLITKENENRRIIQNLNETVASLMQDKAKMQTEIEELTNNLRDMNSSLQVGSKRDQEFCKVYYEGKCFWLVVGTVTFAQGQAKCATVSDGRPAVMYSSEHYEQILTYVRSLTTYTYFWLGLKINPTTKEVTVLPGMTPAPFVKWHLGYPESGMSSTAVMVQVYRDTSNSNQGMFNNRDFSSNAGSVLCEA